MLAPTVITGTMEGLSPTQNSLVVNANLYSFDVAASVERLVRGDSNAIAVQPAAAANFWRYASTTAGIVNTTTAVTIKAAAGASVRNYLCSLQVSHDTLGAVTNLAIRDGAGGTTLWLGRLQTVATDISGGAGTISFNPCLQGTANTLLEVVTLTAATGAVYVSGQGFTGS
jgi:hypothetical protein